MAFFPAHFFSDALGLSVTANVLLPQRTARQIGMSGGAPIAGAKHPVLYLLHGLSDDHTVWMRRTAIERYAAARNLAVIMPAVARSFYQNMASGPQYWTFLSEELPRLMQGFFPLSAEREDNFAAGLSMGGYGALRLGLGCPERFAAAASLSGAVDVARICREADKKGSRLSRAEIESIFGPDLQAKGTEADLWLLAQRAAAPSAPRPRLYQSCGTEDGLLEENRRLHEHLQKIGCEHEYREAPGDHEWSFWDEEIQRVLAWLPLPA